MRKMWLVCFLVLGLVACGKKEEGPSAAKKTLPLQDAKSEVTTLLPANTVAIVHFKSCDAILDTLQRFGKLVDEPPPSEPLRMLGGQMGFDHTKVDTGQPAAIAIGLVGGMSPVPTLILPATDVEGLKGSFAQGKTAVEGSYVALSMAPDYQPGPAAEKLSSGLPAGDAVMRIDLAEIVRQLGPMIEGGLAFAETTVNQQMAATMPGVDAASFTSGIFGWARDFLASAETLDLVGGMPEDTLNFRMIFKAKEGSPMAAPGEASRIAELAGYLGGDYPLALLFNFDMKWCMNLVKQMSGTLVEQMPEEARAAFLKSMADMDKYMKYMGNDWALAFRVGNDGIKATGAMTSPDPAGYIKTALEVMKEQDPAALGINIMNEGEREVEGVTVQRMRMKVDAEKMGATYQMPPEQAAAFAAMMFGANGSLFDLAAVKDRVVFAMSRDGKGIDDALAGGGPSAGVKSLIESAPGNLSFLVHVDLRSFMKGATDFARAMGGQRVPNIPPGGPAPMSLVGSRDGRTFHIALTVDVAGAKQVFKAMD